MYICKCVQKSGTRAGISLSRKTCTKSQEIFVLFLSSERKWGRVGLGHLCVGQEGACIIPKSKYIGLFALHSYSSPWEE